MLAIRRPRNPIGWLFLTAGAGLALSAFALGYATHAVLVVHASWPLVRFFGWVGKWVWPVAFTMLIFLLLTFPDGALRSRRWRPIAWLAAAAGGSLMVATMIVATLTWDEPLSGDPFSVPGVARVIANVAFTFSLITLPVSLIGAFVSVILRFKDSTGEARLQLKWFVVAAGFVAFSFALEIVSGDVTPTWLSVVNSVSTLFLYAAIAIAVLKYRLYEIDVVIGKTVVFAVLAAFITIVYVGLVVGVGTLVGNEPQSAPLGGRGRRRRRRLPAGPRARATAGQPRRVRQARDAVRGAVGVRRAREPRRTRPRTSCRVWRRSWPKGSARARRGVWLARRRGAPARGGLAAQR